MHEPAHGDRAQIELQVAPEADRRDEVVAICEQITKVFREQGYEVVMSAHLAQMLLSGEKIPDSIKDFDFIVTAKNRRVESINIIDLIRSAGGSAVTAVPREGVEAYAAKSRFAATDLPKSEVVVSKFDLGGKEIPAEFFVGNGSGSGYQMEGAFGERQQPFDIHHVLATQPLDESNEDSIRVLTPAALFCYYLSIAKNERIPELLTAFPGKWKQICADAKVLAPQMVLRITALETELFEDSGEEKPLSSTLGQELDQQTEAQKFLVHSQLSVVLNSETNNAGEMITRLRLEWESTGKVLRELTQNPMILAAVEQYEQHMQLADLPFHGGIHGIDIATKSVALAINEKLIPPDAASELTVAIFLAMLFHDSGIALTKSYVDHEANSIMAFGDMILQLLNTPNFEKILSPQLQKYIWYAACAIYGTQFVFKDGKLVSRSESSDEEFKTTLLEKVATLNTQPLQAHLSPYFSQETIVEKMTEALDDPESFALIRKLALVFGTADTIGLTAKNAVRGTAAVAIEAGLLDLEPINYVQRAPDLIPIFQTAARRLEHFPESLIDDWRVSSAARMMQSLYAAVAAYALPVAFKVDSPDLAEVPPRFREEIEAQNVPKRREQLMKALAKLQELQPAVARQNNWQLVFDAN